MEHKYYYNIVSVCPWWALVVIPKKVDFMLIKTLLNSRTFVHAATQLENGFVYGRTIWRCSVLGFCHWQFMRFCKSHGKINPKPKQNTIIDQTLNKKHKWGLRDKVSYFLVCWLWWEIPTNHSSNPTDALNTLRSLAVFVWWFLLS